MACQTPPLKRFSPNDNTLNLSEEERIFFHLVPFWFGTVLSQSLFVSLGVLLVMKTFKDEWCIIVKANKFTVFETCIIILRVCAIPIY